MKKIFKTTTGKKILVKSLGDYLKDCREKAGLTQREIADLLNYDTSQFISNIENNKAFPPADKVKMWCSAIGADRWVIYQYITEIHNQEWHRSLGL